MESLNKVKSFDGTGDVRKFIAKIELLIAIKEYTGEKAAQVLASKLEGNAFDVYLRMSADDRKSIAKIEEELLKEYERGQADREQAVAELNSRHRLPNEPAKTFAFKIQELVKLAYPTLDQTARDVFAKDAYLNGLHPDMQLQIRALEKFKTADMNALVEETLRLEVAGIKSSMSTASKGQINSVKELPDTLGEASGSNITKDLVEAISDEVLKKLEASSINYVRGEAKGQNRNFHRNNRRGRGGDNNISASTRKCRNCQSPSHIVRQCPVRFCASCGGRGHDSWSKDCPKYL